MLHNPLSHRIVMNIAITWIHSTYIFISVYMHVYIKILVYDTYIFASEVTLIDDCNVCSVVNHQLKGFIVVTIVHSWPCLRVSFKNSCCTLNLLSLVLLISPISKNVSWFLFYQKIYFVAFTSAYLLESSSYSTWLYHLYVHKKRTHRAVNKVYYYKSYKWTHVLYFLFYFFPKDDATFVITNYRRSYP